MHKTIARLIKRMVDESQYCNHLFYCDVHPRKTGGFWSVTLHFIDRDNAQGEALVRSLHNIGMVYGEGLGIEDKGSVVEVS